MKLNNFDAQHFLQDYWQKKPVVLRQVFEHPFWIEADVLAGLACEQEVESRIIRQQQEEWLEAHGPFDETFFSSLPEKDWTLLVQAVDHWVPEVRAVLGSFSFLPAWRVDDIMVSYAPVGGTVSQHFDYYDVFLIQGEGRRQWQVGQRCNASAEYVPNSPVRTLKTFSAELDVTLEPGDMLYVPACYAHYGVSLKDSLTYSVGFRAPSVRDIVDGVATEAFDRLQEDSRYIDTHESLKAARGEVPQAAINQIRSMLADALLDDSLIGDWFGKCVTERKYEDLELVVESGDANLSISQLEKNPASRFAYRLSTGESRYCDLYVDGAVYQSSLELATRLTASEVFHLSDIALSEQDTGLIKRLCSIGALIHVSD